MSNMSIDPAPCFVDPADIDWSAQSDLSVIVSAQAGTLEAVAEAQARELL